MTLVVGRAQENTRRGEDVESHALEENAQAQVFGKGVHEDQPLLAYLQEHVCRGRHPTKVTLGHHHDTQLLWGAPVDVEVVGVTEAEELLDEDVPDLVALAQRTPA